MKKTYATFFPIIFCGALALAGAFVDFSPANAQTTETPTRARQVAATPTPTPMPDDDGEVLTFDTELVNLSVRVIDRNNRPISNLAQKDFTILEDNVKQEIGFFSRSEVPTNYSLVIDNSGSLRPQLEKVIEAGKIIVNTNRPDDETSVIRFVSSEKIEILQDFTPNKTDITDALDNLYSEGGQTAIIDAVYLAAGKVTEYEKRAGGEDRKRRALILVSDGEDRDSFYKEAQLFELLRETDVQIYVIGFIGDLSKEGGFISKSPQSKAKSFLEKLATETGGKSYFPDNIGDLDSIARDISSEMRTQYSIGYVPSNERQDGSFRSIKVQIADGPNKQKRIAVTRAGRTAGTEGGSQQKPAVQTQTPIKKGR